GDLHRHLREKLQISRVGNSRLDTADIENAETLVSYEKRKIDYASEAFLIVQGDSRPCPRNHLSDFSCNRFPEALHLSLRIEHHSDSQEGSIIYFNPVHGRVRIHLRGELNHRPYIHVYHVPVEPPITQIGGSTF